MELTAPFGYKSVTPLLREMRLRAPAGGLPEYARNRNSLPIAVGEAIVAGHDYPIAFVAVNENEFAPVIILGLVEGENLFVSSEGWAPNSYFPAYVRRYPYCMAHIPVEGKPQPESIICVETSAIAEDGVPNFDDQGKPTAGFVQVQELLERFEIELDRTRQLCRVFAEYKLFEAMQMQATVGEAHFELKGLHRIAEARLENLLSNQIKNLIRKGGMALIYQHLSSMARFRVLTELKLEAMLKEGSPLVGKAPNPGLANS